MIIGKKTKKILWIAGIMAGIILLSTLLGPYLVLAIARQPEPETDFKYADSFVTTYEEARQKFNERIDTLHMDGVLCNRETFTVDKEDGLYIDTLHLPSKKTKNLIVLTTGVHGMEGYIGSVMLDVFFEEIYPTLNKEDTGVLVVANVNPYGMKYYRRYNENNVDLNRNFILDWESHDRDTNKDYPTVQNFLEPRGEVGNAFWHDTNFLFDLGKEAIRSGADKISDALLTGQYRSHYGIYFGGAGDEKSTRYLKNVFNDCLDSRYGDYENIIHLDIHSGYGPRYNMVIFNSIYETETEAESVKAYGYDYVIAHDSESFYATTGDTTDFFYRLAEQKKSDKDLFSTCFEFGTLGDTFLDSILSLKYTIDENRMVQYPGGNRITEEIIRERYMELYYPTETKWREKTVEDFIAATNGVLKNKLK